MFDELPADPQAEAEAVLLLVLTNRQEDSGVSILFPVNLLPRPATFADSFRLDPRGDRDRLGRFESGVVGYFDGVRTAVTVVPGLSYAVADNANRRGYAYISVEYEARTQ